MPEAKLLYVRSFRYYRIFIMSGPLFDYITSFGTGNSHFPLSLWYPKGFLAAGAFEIGVSLAFRPFSFLKTEKTLDSEISRVLCSSSFMVCGITANAGPAQEKERGNIEETKNRYAR